MANILHVCNWFDPAADVVRCVNELSRYSRHRHSLLVHDPHPLQAIYQFEEPSGLTDPNEAFAWADAVLYQFVGWECGYGRLKKPCAFRNINVYWRASDDKFWTDPQYNASSLNEYRLLASSHVGAGDFLPGCRFLPDLIPLDQPKYKPSWEDRTSAISYIKHAAELDASHFGDVLRINCYHTAHDSVLHRRKHEATVVIDNVEDGHYGLAGLESLALGLPTVVFNHSHTSKLIRELGKSFLTPFVEVGPSVPEALERAIRIAKGSSEELWKMRAYIRWWMEAFYHSQLLISRYWDPFLDELCRG